MMSVENDGSKAICKILNSLIFILIFGSLSAQVGVNTTNPDVSSILDVTASDKGILIPRVNLTNVTMTQLDGSNTAATGLLIYNTNASVVGGSGIGFYVFNGTSWEKLTTTSDSFSDADFFEEGTTNSPTSITDNIYTEGNLAIGKSNPDTRLDIQDGSSNDGSLKITTNRAFTASETLSSLKNEVVANGGVSGVMLGFDNQLGGSTLRQYGIRNKFLDDPTDGIRAGIYNDLNDLTGNNAMIGVANYLYGEGSNKRAIANFIDAKSSFFPGGVTVGMESTFAINGPGNHYGQRNFFGGTTAGSGVLYGVSNNFDYVGNGTFYGLYNRFDAASTGTGAKYGVYNEIPTAVGGTHYGIYSNVLKTNSYAGYFLGRVSVGDSDTTNYLLPISRGTNGQIMQTDGSGNLSWIDPSTLTSDRWSLNGNSGTNPNINFVGTTDNSDLVFRTNNSERLRINVNGSLISPNSNIRWGNNSGNNITSSSGNILLGNNSGRDLTNGAQNVLIGSNAGARVTSGNSVIAIGLQALGNYQGSLGSVAIGPYALALNSTGFSNIAIGSSAMRFNANGALNIAIGLDALRTGNTSSSSLALGHYALVNSRGTNNIAIGNESLESSITGTRNVAIGIRAAEVNLQSGNTVIGYSSFENNTNGSNNTIIGNLAASIGATGTQNVMLGAFSGRFVTGNGNVLLGYASGSNVTALSNTLMIENSNSNNPLLYGEFDNDIVRVNGTLQVGNPVGTGYAFPATDGTANQVLQTNGTGTLNWVDASSLTANSWSLLGNSGTNSTTNFIGTVDNVDLIFRRNNIIYGIFGNNNTSIGKFSLVNNTGLYNTAYGNFAMSNQISGNYNTAVGEQAMQRHENGSTNTTLGALSLYLNETGSGNVAIGFQAGRSELGSNRLYIENSSSTTPLIYGEFDNDILRTYGDFQVNDPSNTGQSGLIQNDDSFVHLVDANIDFGGGGNHMMLSSQEGGFETGGIHVDGNSVTIWSPADGLRALRILDEDDWDDSDGNPFNNNAELAYIDNNGQYVQASDENRKQNIRKINNALERIQQINGYTYDYKINSAERSKGEKVQQSSGVLAQELQKVLPEAVQVSESGEFFVHYAGITPLLIEAIKALKMENLELKAEYNKLEQRLQKLETLMSAKIKN